jgi:hypothetical protein
MAKIRSGKLPHLEFLAQLRQLLARHRYTMAPVFNRITVYDTDRRTVLQLSSDRRRWARGPAVWERKGMKRLCYGTADSDPNGDWIEIEATSIFHAAIYYCGACAARPGGPRPARDSIITVRVDGKEYRVREERVREWANARAERDAQRRKAAEKKSRRA